MNGAPLAAERLAGTPGQPAIVLLHGFTQNLRCWGSLPALVAQGRSVWGIDLPGHGLSGHDEATFEEAAELVARTIAAIDPPIDTVVGYSMGGRMALRAALDHPDLCHRLVLIGATAGLDDESERTARRGADARLAERLEREGPERFLDFWLGLPLFEGLDEATASRSERLDRWGSGVAETLLHRGTGSMEPLWSRVGDLQIPTVVVVGERDAKFRSIGERLVSGIGGTPLASLIVIEGAGHACHSENPAAVAAAVRADS